MAKHTLKILRTPQDFLSMFRHFTTLWMKGLSDCNGNQTHNHLVRKRILKHLAKKLSVRLLTRLL